jgi:hypothetical protein
MYAMHFLLAVSASTVSGALASIHQGFCLLSLVLAYTCARIFDERDVVHYPSFR